MFTPTEAQLGGAAGIPGRAWPGKIEYAVGYYIRFEVGNPDVGVGTPTSVDDFYVAVSPISELYDIGYDVESSDIEV